VARFSYERWFRLHPTIEEEAPAVIATIAVGLSLVSLVGYYLWKGRAAT
jgi:hypothetical protein